MKISVITVTNRVGGIDINWSSLRRQTFDDFEWVLVDTLYEKRKDAVKQYTKNDPRVKHIQQTKKDPKAKTWLNHAENEGIKNSEGELIVFLQDYINIAPDALEKYWYAYQQNKKSMITGVGHQYGKPGKEDVVDHEGLITVFKEPFEREPEVIVWEDPRIDVIQGSFVECPSKYIEFNFCAIPKEMLYQIGGCDESLDYVGHAWDNVSVAVRGELLGYKSFMDKTNISRSVRHDDFFETKVKDNDWREIEKFCIEKLIDIRDGKLPINLGYI